MPRISEAFSGRTEFLIIFNNGAAQVVQPRCPLVDILDMFEDVAARCASLASKSEALALRLSVCEGGVTCWLVGHVAVDRGADGPRSVERRGAELANSSSPPRARGIGFPWALEAGDSRCSSAAR